LRLRRISALLRRINAARTVATLGCVAAMVTVSAGSASAAAPSVSPYGEVARFGGLDKGASYSTAGSAPTTGLTGVGQPAQFVYPVGMAVDTEDPNAPDKYAIYVLENLNPQALDAGNSNAPTSLSLEYRIQKISDSGTVLASKSFTLTSSASEPGLHAVSLAVDGPADRVYALIEDVPSVSENSEGFGAAVGIDAWTTGREAGKQALEPAVKLTTGIADDLPEDPSTHAGELAGPSHDPLQGLGGNEFVGDIDGASLAVYGHGAGSDLVLGGNQYVSASTSQPAIELVKTGGAQAGQVDGSPWTDAAATETSDAKSAGQSSAYLYSLSANEGESLNVSLGGQTQAEFADFEPNMATVDGGALGSTTALFPSGIVGENFAQPEPFTNGLFNADAAVTMSFSQDIHSNEPETFMPWGATRAAGALAPSVMQLDAGAGFPAGLYAGVVADQPGTDRQNPTPRTPHTWTEVNASQERGGTLLRQITSPASLGVRVFDTAGESLAMIGDATPGGVCNLQSSPPGAGPFAFSDPQSPSFVALAPGREGVVFVLVQPDLLNVEGASGEGIAPEHAVGAGEGDQIVEFAPAGGAGAGANASNYHECPQPEGSFSIANETLQEPPSTGSGEVSVQAGTTLKFNAEEVKGPKGEYVSGVNLRGGSAWAYDWNLDGGTSKGAGPLFEFPWTVRNTFTETPEENQSYLWPLPTVEAEFKTPGVYTETLKLVNDFGTLTAARTLRVIEPGKITEPKISASSGPTEGQPVLLNASAKLPADDKVKDYHWEFGDGQGEDTGEHAAVEHTYASAGSYIVKLTISDTLGQEAHVEETVVVVAKKETTTTTTSSTSTGTSKSVTTTTTTTTKTTTTQTKSKPLTRAQKLTAALKACKKIKAHKKRVHCEKQALKKYGTKRKTKAKRGARRK
jgi:PKD repeat protein